MNILYGFALALAVVLLGYLFAALLKPESFS